MGSSMSQLSRQALEERLRELGGAYVRPTGPLFKEYCLKAMKRMYPTGMPDVQHHRAAIWDYLNGWADCLFAHRAQANQEWLLGRFKAEIERMEILHENWEPDDSWKWW